MPCRLLRDAQVSRYLARANAVLAVRDHPHSHHPLIKAQRGILENGSDLDSELRSRMFAVALPAALLGEVRDLLRTA